MPVRGSGANGHAKNEDKRNVDISWRRLKAAVMQSPERIRGLILGDLNAETDEMRAMGGGRARTPADAWLQAMVDTSVHRRMGNLEWTYMHMSGTEREARTIIDHVYAGPEAEANVKKCEKVQGLETEGAGLSWHR